MMHVDDAVLVSGAFRAIHVVQRSNMGGRNRRVGAPNQLN